VGATRDIIPCALSFLYFDMHATFIGDRNRLESC
jgi:hypothetical protein